MQLFPNSLLRRSVFLLIAKFNIYAICSSDKKTATNNQKIVIFFSSFHQATRQKKKMQTIDVDWIRRQKKAAPKNPDWSRYIKSMVEMQHTF